MATPKPGVRRPVVDPTRTPPADHGKAAAFIEGSQGPAKSKPPAEEPARTTIRLPPSLAKRLGHYCVETEETQTAVIIEALEKHLSSKGA